MHVTYSRKIAKYLESDRYLKREFPNKWKMIQLRIKELRAAVNARELLYGKPHPLKGSSFKGQ